MFRPRPMLSNRSLPAAGYTKLLLQQLPRYLPMSNDHVRRRYFHKRIMQSGKEFMHTRAWYVLSKDPIREAIKFGQHYCKQRITVRSDDCGGCLFQRRRDNPPDE